MNYPLMQAVLIAGASDEESTFWMQILVFSLLVVSWWVYSLFKKERNQFQNQHQKFTSHHAKSHSRFQLPRKYISLGKDITQRYVTKMRHLRLHPPTSTQQEPITDFSNPPTFSQEKPVNELVIKKNKNLDSGMELLALDFLLSIVEDTAGKNQKDVTMRKLNFNELLRRKKLNQVNSKALKVYAINQGDFYGKGIQCEAMRELTERTLHSSKRNSSLVC